jgi:organic hydroperoxide reductase OsmC/OhrA
MIEEATGAGQFSRVVLRPLVTVAEGTDLARARALHADAHAKCFIARSVRFPVEHEPEFREE